MGFVFENGDVTENNGISPEDAAALGLSFCNVMGKKVVVSHTEGVLTMVIKNALISGALVSGASVLDFGEQPLAITRRGINFYNLDGGFHISDGGRKITMLGKDGIRVSDETEKEVVTAYSAGNLPRTREDYVKEVVSLGSYKLYYLRDIINRCKSISGFNLLLSVKNKTSQSILTAILKDMGCKYTLYKGYGTENFSNVIIKDGYDMGVHIDESGEKLTLFDEKGNAIDGDVYNCISAIITFSLSPDKTFYASYDMPSSVERIAEKMGGKIVRIKNVDSYISSKTKGDFQFILRFDAIGSLIIIMDYLKQNDVTLSKLAQAVPEFYVSKKEYVLNSDLFDKFVKKAGIKNIGERIEEKKGWAFIEKNKNLIKVVCEGVSTEASTELAEKYEKIIKGIKA